MKEIVKLKSTPQTTNYLEREEALSIIGGACIGPDPGDPWPEPEPFPDPERPTPDPEPRPWPEPDPLPDPEDPCRDPTPEDDTIYK